MPTETDKTLDEPGYKQLGPGADNGNEFPWFEQALSLATRQIQREDLAGHILRAVDMHESSLMSMDLIRDDIGWHRLTGGSSLDMPDALRTGIVHRARQYGRHDGNTKQTVALYTNFAVGKGFTWTVGEEAEKAQEVLDELTTSKWNRKMFSTQGQRDLSDALYTDGEVFFALFVEPDTVKIRMIDQMEIAAILTNPEDKSEPRVYVRKYFVGTQEKVLLYRDWMWDGTGDVMDAQGQAVTGEEADAVVFHVKAAGRGLRGESRLIADMDWAKQYRAFMTSRAAVARVIAMFPAKLKMLTDAAGLSAAKAQLGTGLSQSSSETNPPPVAGSTFLENAGATYSTVRQETGAASAKVDAELFMQALAIGSGIFPHYLGLGNSFRLATADSMEPPMMKAFEAYQELWRDVYQLIFEWVMEQMDVPEAERNVTVKGEAIREEDVGPKVDGIEKTVRTFPALAESDELAKYALTLLGMSDPSAVMAELTEAFGKIPGHNVVALVHKALQEVLRQQEG